MPPTKKQFDVLGLGVVAIDDVIFVASYPPADTKSTVLGRQRCCGGLTAIALISAARLGGSCAYAGVLGPDALSQFGLQCLRQENIDVTNVRQTGHARPIHSNIVVDQRRGTRNIFFDLHGVMGAPRDVPPQLIARSRVLFIDNFGVKGMIRAARLARREKVPVVADFESCNDPGFSELMRLTDHLILSHEVVRKLTGKKSTVASIKALAAGGHEVVAVTCGVDGCWYLERGMEAPRHQAAFKVNAVDTTGCGDVFHGAYAFGLARNLSLPERMKLASAAAALKASHGGGIEGIPSMEQVRKLLKHELMEDPTRRTCRSSQKSSPNF
jgi:sugar/nucleoside kinase (ribokinase family)